MAKGQEAHNLAKVVDPDRFEEKRYVIHYHQQIYKGGLFACQSPIFYFFLHSSPKKFENVDVDCNLHYPARKQEYLE